MILCTSNRNWFFADAARSLSVWGLRMYSFSYVLLIKSSQLGPEERCGAVLINHTCFFPHLAKHCVHGSLGARRVTQSCSHR